VTYYPHVNEYIIMAAEIIRLRKHMKKTIVYLSQTTASAYREACDSVIDEQDFIKLFQNTDVEPVAAALPTQAGKQALNVSPQNAMERAEDALRRYFEQSGANYEAPAASIGHMFIKEFGHDVCDDWFGYKTLSQLLKHMKGYEVFAEEKRLFVRVANAG